MAPKLGLSPTTPLNAAGLMTDPSVCVPRASGTIPAATAAADPDDEPPGVCLLFQGLTVGPGCRQANSVDTGLPNILAPRLRRRSTTQAALAGKWTPDAADPFAGAHVGAPSVALIRQG